MFVVGGWIGGGADTNYLYPARWGWIKNCMVDALQCLFHEKQTDICIYVFLLYIICLLNVPHTIHLSEWVTVARLVKCLLYRQKIISTFHSIHFHVHYHTKST